MHRFRIISALLLVVAPCLSIVVGDSPPRLLVDAAARGDREAVEGLLEQGIDIDSRGTGGLTALHVARIRGYEELAKFLLERGADADIAMPPPEKPLDAFFTEIVEGDSPGAAVLVAVDGKVVFKKGYGHASLEHRAPITPETKFRIGSITKQFAATAVLLLRERGKLSVEDRLSKFLPDYPRGDEVTIHHLLIHTSGIRSYTSKPDFLATATTFTAPEALIDSFKNDPYDFSPGESRSYNNSGYFLLGFIVGKVSGESWGDFLEKNVFEPHAMHDTGVHHYSLILAHEATGYAFENGELKKALDWDMSRAGGAGALYSTVEDLFRWNEALFGGKVLTAASLEAAFTPVKVGDDGEAPSGGYGYGWAIGKHRGLRVIAHSGGLHGFSSHLARYPEQKLTVTVLANAAPPIPGLAPAELSNRAAELYLWKEMEAVGSKEVDESVTRETLADYVGLYDYGGPVLTVTLEKGRLFAQLTGQAKHEIFPAGDDAFFWKVVEAEVTFLRDDKGVVVKARHNQGGVQFTAATFEEPKTAVVDAAIYDAYTGKYDCGGGALILTITKEDDRLFAQLTGQPKLEIVPKSATEFFFRGIKASAEFVKDDGGKVKHVILRQGGRTIEAPRL